MREPLTVRDLIAKLREFDQDAVVMIECEDSYYSGPLSEDLIDEGIAVYVAEHTAPTEMTYGRPADQIVVKRDVTYQAGVLAYGPDDEQRDDLPITDRKPCVRLHAGG